MSVPQLLVLLVLHQLHSHITQAADELTVRAQEYMLCPLSMTFNGNELFSVAGQSSLDCVKRCSQTMGCLAVNVCPNGHGAEQTTCRLFKDHNPDGCQDLTVPDGSGSCFFAQKVCKNGGTPVGDTCQCLIQYAGRYCQRVVRDCAEIYEAGYTTSTYNGVYFIQPVTSPHACQVRCDFSYGGAMYVMRQKTHRWNTENWTSIKRGLGQDLTSVPNSYDYFIGMENLHHLTTQASYQLLVWFFGTPNNAGAFYHNCSIGSEDTGFALLYDSFTAGPNALKTENGFPTTTPVPFSTSDRDRQGCAGTRGAPGWYGSACTGYSLFANLPVWPVDSTTSTASKLFVSVQRTSTRFYADP